MYPNKEIHCARKDAKSSRVIPDLTSAATLYSVRRWRMQTLHEQTTRRKCCLKRSRVCKNVRKKRWYALAESDPKDCYKNVWRKFSNKVLSRISFISKCMLWWATILVRKTTFRSGTFTAIVEKKWFVAI